MAFALPACGQPEARLLLPPFVTMMRTTRADWKHQRRFETAVSVSCLCRLGPLDTLGPKCLATLLILLGVLAQMTGPAVSSPPSKENSPSAAGHHYQVQIASIL